MTNDSYPQPFQSKWFDEQLESALQSILGQTATESLVTSIRYSALSPGKRLRPRLMFASAKALGLDPAQVTHAAIALELIHCFTLIHDDLPCLDNDDFRRGQPSNHKKFGEAAALLAGDALIPAALELFIEPAFISPGTDGGSPNSIRVLKALQRLLRLMGASGTIGGQALELDIQKTSQNNRALADRVNYLKTGTLFEAALLIPADWKGLSENSREFVALQTFARAFGQAFQLADDLEDLPAQQALELKSSETQRQSTILQQSEEQLAHIFGDTLACDLILESKHLRSLLTP